MSLIWRPLSLQEQPLIQKYLPYAEGLSDYSFTNLWMWHEERHYEWVEVDHFLCLRHTAPSCTWLTPLGVGPPPLQELLKDAGSTPLQIRAIPKQALPFYQTAWPHALIEQEPGRFDYLYRFEDLLYLRGNRYQAKRNLIHQFERAYSYTYRPLTLDILPQVLIMEEKWKALHTADVINEHRAILRALHAYKELPLEGGTLWIDDEVIAYSFAEYMDKEILLIHAEKALATTYKGAYPMIQQQLLLHLRPTSFINREEDLLKPHLTFAKESYHPIEKKWKYRVAYKNSF